MRPTHMITTTTCPHCQRADFASISAVRGHLGRCPMYQRGQKKSAAPAFVAEVKPAAAAPAEPLPSPPADVAAAPAFVAAVDVPPPPPPPPAAAEATQFVDRMPMPQPAAGTGGVALEEWRPVQAFPNQLAELHAGQPPAVAEVATSTATVSVTPVGQAAAAQPGTLLAPVPEGPKPAVDVVKVMQVLSKRVFTWEGSGALTDEESELLRQVITWQPGPLAGGAVVVGAIFIPRVLTHPKVADAIGKLMVAGIDNLLAKLGDGDETKPTAAAVQQPAASSSAHVNSPAAAPAAAAPAAPPQADLVREAWARRGVDLAAVEAEQRAARAELEAA